MTQAFPIYLANSLNSSYAVMPTCAAQRRSHEQSGTLRLTWPLPSPTPPQVSGPAVAQAVSEAGSLLGASRTMDLVSLLLTTADTFLPKASAADLEYIMALLINLVPGASSAQEVDDTATLIATELASAATEHRTAPPLHLLSSLPPFPRPPYSTSRSLHCKISACVLESVSRIWA